MDEVVILFPLSNYLYSLYFLCSVNMPLSENYCNSIRDGKKSGIERKHSQSPGIQWYLSWGSVHRFSNTLMQILYIPT